MIRMLFALFITLAGFTAAALWMARGGDPREAVEEILPAELRSEVTSQVRSAIAQFDLEEVASRLPGPVPKQDASGDSNAAAAAEDTAEPEKAEVAETALEARDLPARAEFARDLGALEDDEEAASAVGASARSWGDDGAPPPAPDQDEWASRIRRMLAVYHRTGAVE